MACIINFKYFSNWEGRMSEAAQQALSILRDPAQFKWYVIPLLAFVFYVYVVETEKKNWSLVLAGLAFWGMDWFNEIWNSLVFHFTGYAPVWGAPGNTAFLLLIGLNIEICFMFAVSGVIWTKMCRTVLGMKKPMVVKITAAVSASLIVTPTTLRIL